MLKIQRTSLDISFPTCNKITIYIQQKSKLLISTIYAIKILTLVYIYYPKYTYIAHNLLLHKLLINVCTKQIIKLQIILGIDIYLSMLCAIYGVWGILYLSI